MMQESHRGQRKTREIGSVETEVRQHLKEGRISSLLPWKPQKIACEAEGVIRTYEAFYLREVSLYLAILLKNKVPQTLFYMEEK